MGIFSPCSILSFGWLSAQNYVLEYNDKINSLNIYKIIADIDTPVSLLSILADKLTPLSSEDIYDNVYQGIEEGTVDDMEDGVYINYLHFFKVNNFYTD